MKSAFSTFSSSVQVKRARDSYDETPFEYIIENARTGEKDAIFYLIYTSINVIASAFYKFYIKTLYDKLSAEESIDKSHEYFNNLIIYLYQSSKKGEGPLHTFDQHKFTDQSKEFILNKFRYYMYRFGQRIALILSKKDKEVSDKEKHFYSVNTTTDGNSEVDPIENIAQPEPYNPLTDHGDFVDWLKVQNIKLYRILIYMAAKMSPQDIAEKEGYKNFTYVYEVITKIGMLYQQFMDTNDNKIDSEKNLNTKAELFMGNL